MPYLSNYEHDIFVSYAHGPGDDLLLCEWTRNLADYLEKELLVSRPAGKSRDRKPSMWIDRNLRGNEAPDSALKEVVEKSALFLVVMSDHYLDSDYCKTELDWFIGERKRRKQSVDGRIFVVRGLHTARPWPPGLRDATDSALLGYWFHRKPESDHHRPRPFGWTTFKDITDELTKVSEKLAADIWTELGKFDEDNQRAPAPPPTPTPKHSVFLGFVHDTLDDERKELRAALTNAGLAVLPPVADDPVDEETLGWALERYLPQTSAMVLIANEFRGTWPRDSSQPAGFISLQMQKASEAKKCCDFWLMSDVAKARRPEYRQYLEVIAKDAEAAKSTIRHQDVVAFVECVVGNLKKVAAPTTGKAVICKNGANNEVLGRAFLQTVKHTLAEVQQKNVIYTFDIDEGKRIELSTLAGHVRDAQTVLVLCYDQKWQWVEHLIAVLINDVRDLHAQDKIRVFIAGPEDAEGPELDLTAFGFETLNAVKFPGEFAEARVKDELRKAIEAARPRLAPHQQNSA